MSFDSTKLRNALKNADLTPMDLAVRSGVSLAGVYKLLSGKSKNPQTGTIQRISTVLGQSIDSLCTDDQVSG